MEKEYFDLLKSGMFWEFYPHLTGDYEKDKDQWKKEYSFLKKLRKKHDNSKKDIPVH